MTISLFSNWFVRGAWGAAMLMATTVAVAAPPVPGMGQKLSQVGDDFEDEEWSWTPNLPKSSNNIDNRTRSPLGTSKNGRLYESALRGAPDVIKRVLTPEGGLDGSHGALLIQTTRSGSPDYLSNAHQQDDLIVSCIKPLKGSLPVSRIPSVVVRVYLPPFEEWEQRSGVSFGFRADCHTSQGQKGEPESYWPGYFIQYNAPNEKKGTPASATLLVRARESGSDVRVKEIAEPGWWTLGMSFTYDGYVHYFAHAGVGDLGSSDHLCSYRPYGFRCERFKSFFFNVANWDNGRSQSTAWIIDDPSVYVASSMNLPTASQAPPTYTRQKAVK